MRLSPAKLQIAIVEKLPCQFGLATVRICTFRLGQRVRKSTFIVILPTGNDQPLLSRTNHDSAFAD